MKSVFVCCLLLLVNCFSFAQQSKQDKLLQLSKRTDIKVTEVEKDILKLKYPNGKLLYKNIREYKSPESGIEHLKYSPTFDSTIIDLTTIDTTLYYQKYKFWQEVPLGNFRTLLVGDVNNNGRPELYGQIKDYLTDYTDIKAFEIDQQGTFNLSYSYGDSTVIARTIYDINKDDNNELHLVSNYADTSIQWYVNSFLYYKKSVDSTLANELSFIFQPRDTNSQQNDNYFGDWDGDEFTDQIFVQPSPPEMINIYEYNSVQNNFDKIFQYNYFPLDLFYSGFSIGDFDQDGKTEFFSGSIHGKILSIENCGDNCYAPNWQGMVETYNAYLCTETNDLDGNGKKEIWIGGDAFYNGVGITRITLFEANDDNSYEVVGRIDLRGIFSFDAGNIQVIDVDKDGKQEVLLGLDQTVLILKFNGSLNDQTYEVFFIKKNAGGNNNMGYYGANLYNLIDDERDELLINMWNIIPNFGIKWFNWIYKPDFTVDVKNENNLLPGNYNVHPVYPNPFNPGTNIRFDIFRTSFTTIKVYNSLGKEITTLLEKELTPGSYTLNWEAKDSNGQLLPTGVYLIRFNSGNYTRTTKAVLLK